MGQITWAEVPQDRRIEFPKRELYTGQERLDYIKELEDCIRESEEAKRPKPHVRRYVDPNSAEIRSNLHLLAEQDLGIHIEEYIHARWQKVTADDVLISLAYSIKGSEEVAGLGYYVNFAQANADGLCTIEGNDIVVSLPFAKFFFPIVKSVDGYSVSSMKIKYHSPRMKAPYVTEHVTVPTYSTVEGLFDAMFAFEKVSEAA